jgi:Probable sensor domain DACNV
MSVHGGPPLSGNAWLLRPECVSRIQLLLSSLAKEIGDKGRKVDSNILPTEADLAEMVTVAMWATMRPDEGRFPRFSLVFGPAMSAPLVLSERPFNAREVARLAPALTEGESSIGVHRSDGGALKIWGLFSGRTSSVVVRGHAPGYVTVSIGAWNAAAFRQDDFVDMVRFDSSGHALGQGREHVLGVLAKALEGPRAEAAVTAALLLLLLDVIRRHGNGGTLLVLPPKDSDRDAALEWIDMGANETQVSLRSAVEHYANEIRKEESPLEAVCRMPELGGGYGDIKEQEPKQPPRAVSVIGNLSGVDGALVLTEDLNLLAFGATIRSPSTRQLEPDRIFKRSFLDYPFPDRPGEEVDIFTLGGTRRQSAARFVRNNFGTLAFAISHDSPIGLGIWFDEKDGRRAHWMTDLEVVLA